jgi:hypothetical protein
MVLIKITFIHSGGFLMKKRILLTFALVLILALSSCNFPLFNDAGAEDVANEGDLMATAVAGTMQAMGAAVQAQQEQQAQAPAEQQAPAQEAAPVDTSTPFPTVAAGPPTATAAPCNKAEFYAETVEDGSQFNLGESFTKSWTFTNTGTCTWNTGYKLVFVSGDQMEAPQEVNFPQNVAPQATVTLSVDLTAPWTEGEYTGYWALKGDNDVVFHSNISVNIEATSSAFRIDSITTDITDHEPSCPYDFYYYFKFTSTSAGKMSYKVKYTDITNGTETETGYTNLAFSSAETKKENLVWSGLGEGSYKIQVYVDTPNHQWFGPYKFDITCAP